ncbi:MAG: GntR family transcriptional regulator [Pseudosphingobacterium sp.]|nr:GntR family transcriptional regulator [Pseudosphingobacterium sp.]
MAQRLGKKLFQINPSEGKNLPKYLQVERYIRDQIKSGVFQEGLVLPSLRDMADENGVSTGTVRRALSRLRSQGWLRSESKQGAIIDGVPAGKSDSHIRAKEERKLWRFRPDASLPTPVAAGAGKLSKAYVKALTGYNNSSVQENSSLKLRKTIARVLFAERELPPGEKNYCVLPWGVHILEFLAERFLSGRMVMVCCPFDSMVMDILKKNLVFPLPLQVFPDERSISLIQVEALCKTQPVKVLLLDTSAFMAVAGPLVKEKMEGLLLLANKYHLLIIEYNPDYDLWFGEGKYPLISSLRWQDHVLYLGRFSSLLSPLNRGFLCGSEQLMEMFAADLKGAGPASFDILDETTSELLASDRLSFEAREIRKRLITLRRKVEELLTSYLGEYVSFFLPPAGLSCWLYLKEGIDSGRVLEEAESHGIRLLHQSEVYLGYPAGNALYFAFAGLDAEMAREIILMLRDIFRDIKP